MKSTDVVIVDIYVQSASVNRKLVEGQKLLTL